MGQMWPREIAYRWQLRNCVGMDDSFGSLFVAGKSTKKKFGALVKKARKFRKILVIPRTCVSSPLPVSVCAFSREL